MNPNWLGVIAVALALAAFGAVYQLAKKRPPCHPVLLLLLTFLVSISGASFTIYHAHVFPEAAWYYQFRSFSGIELLVIFPGVAGGLLAALLPRVLLVLPLAGSQSQSS